MALTCKVTIPQCTTPGDYIWCKYTGTSNTFGTFSLLGTKTDADVGSSIIPVAGAAAPNAHFKFIFVGYDMMGRKKFIADRNIQHSISYDKLLAAGVASGSGLPITIDTIANKYTIRLLTGGTSAYDLYNEWDMIIAYYNLGGRITAGDNAIWHWSAIYSVTSTAGQGAAAVYRGHTAVEPIADSSYVNTTATNYVNANSGFRPVLLVEPVPNYYLFLKEDGTAHKYDGSAIVQVSSNWSALTVAEKETLYLAASTVMPNIELFATLGKYKIMIYSQDTAMAKPTGIITAAPKDVVVLPKGLIPIASFEGIDNVTLTNNLSGAGAILLAVTTDLTTYKVFSGGTWVTIDITNAATFKAGGMTPAQLTALTRANWNLLTTGKEGIGFAYLPTVEAVTDVSITDKIAFVVDMKGAWTKAVHGTDFTYAYPRNNLLRINLLTNGDYKINYHESAK